MEDIKIGYRVRVVKIEDGEYGLPFYDVGDEGRVIGLELKALTVDFYEGHGVSGGWSRTSVWSVLRSQVDVIPE